MSAETNEGIYFDFSKERSLENRIVALRGHAQFFWGQLLLPGDIRMAHYVNPMEVPFPESWTTYKFGEDYLPYSGCATYRFFIVMPQDARSRAYGITFPTIFSSANIWINGQQMSGVGKVSSNPYEIQSRPRRLTLPILPSNGRYFRDTTEVVVQVANFVYPRAGIRLAPSFSGYDHLIFLDRIYENITYLILGACFALLLIRFLLATSQRSHIRIWYFVVVLFCCVVRISTGESALILQWIPSMKWDLFYSLRFMSNVLGGAFVLLMIGELFPQELSRRVTFWMAGVGVLLFFFVLCTDPVVFAAYPVIFSIYLALVGVLGCGWGLLRAVIRRRPYAVYSLVGVLSMMLAVGIDYLFYLQGQASLRPLIALGVGVFFLMSMLVILQMRNGEFLQIESEGTSLRKERKILQASCEKLEGAYRQLQEVNKQNKQFQRVQQWEVTGLDSVSNIFVRHRDDFHTLCKAGLESIARYLNVNVGTVYLARYDEDGTGALHLETDYGLTEALREQHRVIAIGQGIVGACHMDNTAQYITDLPENFLKISTGLGSSVPPNLLVLPLESDSGTLGVMELGRLTPFESHEFELVRKLVPLFANNLRNSHEMALMEESKIRHLEELAKSQSLVESLLEEVESLKHELIRFRPGEEDA